MTENGNSIVDQRSLFLGRNLNLTELEKQVRRAHGLPTREPSQSNSHIEAQPATNASGSSGTHQEVHQTTDYPYFGSEYQKTMSVEQQQQ